MKKNISLLFLLAVVLIGVGYRGSVVKAAATKAVWTVQPTSPIVVGTTITGGPTVSIEDSNGVVITGDNTSSVTIVAAEPNASTTAAAGGVLSGTITKTVSSGVAVFNDLAFPSVGVIVLRADVSGLTSGVSNVVNIIAGTSLASAKAPTSSITSPLGNTNLTPGSQVTITGTVAQGSTSSIQKVEISFDGTKTWNATILGSGNWSYNWIVPSVPGTVVIQSRATDWLGKVETPSAGVTVTVAGTSSPAAPVVVTPTTPNPSSPGTPSAPAPSAQWASGTLVKVNGNGTVYMVVNGVLRPFTSAAVFHAQGKKFADVQNISASDFMYSTVGTPVGYPAGTAIKGSKATVFLITVDGGKQGIPSMAVYRKLKIRSIVRVSDDDLATYVDEGVAQ